MNRNELVGLMLGNLERITIAQAVYNLIAALVCVCIIFTVYYLTSKEAKPTAMFAVTLIIVTLSVTILVMLIGSNLALSLGMVGALSVIRFRAAVKDSRDAAFIFFAIAAGMACALSVYAFALVSTLFIAIIILIFSFFDIGARTYLVTVKTSDMNTKAAEDEFTKISGKRFCVIAVASKRDDTDRLIVESTYEIGLKREADELCANILGHDGVLSVSAVLREE